MKKTTWIFVACAFLALSCNALESLTATPDSGSAPFEDCPIVQPTDTEVDQARQYKADVFPSDDWKMSYTVMENRVSVTRKNDLLGSVINFDTVYFCGVTNAKLDEYYTDSILDIIFQYYDTYEIQTDCSSGDTRLYEIGFNNLGFDYNGRYWVEILDQDHIRETLVVFPVSDTSSLDAYSEQLMPKLHACE